MIDEPFVHALCFSGEEGTFPTRIKGISPRGAFIGSVAQLFGFWHNYPEIGTINMRILIFLIFLSQDPGLLPFVLDSFNFPERLFNKKLLLFVQRFAA
ncbi:hypothetical protein [Rossellomorea aquimaris]|uniref:hypothetical protein n=1 Tax=Rossellomorea aquimaris TaxID=189382 RepID=UPI00114D4720|nr:hypothetical protein [Rossellomorea aquimaris]